MLVWEDDLKIAPAGLYLDSRTMRDLCFVSHAHSDHLAAHRHGIMTPQTAVLADHRVGPQPTTELPFDQPHDLDRDTRITLHSAGHVLGSAMLHVARPEGTLLYTGDFKLRPSLTVPPAYVVQADTLLMETTYGLPMFRFPPWKSVAAQLVDLATKAIRSGRQPVVLGYSLGKAQEIVRILTDAGLNVTCHGAVHTMVGLYEQLGVPLGAVRRYVREDFHGPKQLDLDARGVLVGPPQSARTAFVDKFDGGCRIMMSGWGLLKNAQYRYGVDHVLPLSDHADFDELLELVDRVRPKKILTHHGYPEFAEHLRSLGLDAELARPAGQLRLF